MKLKHFGVLFLLLAFAGAFIVGCGGGNGGDNDTTEDTVNTDKGKKGGRGKGGDTTPKPTQTEEAVAPSFVNVFIDHSGSMNGYVETGNLIFVNAISDMKSLLPGNGTVKYWGDDKTVVNDIANELAKHNFNGQDTPFQQIFSLMGKAAVNDNALSVLVTDGMIGVKDASHLLDNLGAIKNEIRDSLRLYPDVAVCLYRLVSGYSTKLKNSYYCTYKNERVKLPGIQTRPFFLIAVGKKEAIRWMIQTIDKDNSLNAYRTADRLVFGNHKHDPKLSFSDKKHFKKEKGKLTWIKSSDREIALSADIPQCIIDDLGKDYILSNMVVEVNGKPNSNIRADLSGKTLILGCKDVKGLTGKDQKITVKLKKNIPMKWSGWSSGDDSNIKTDSLQWDKTFALDYLIKGIDEGTGDNNLMLIDGEVSFVK